MYDAEFSPVVTNFTEHDLLVVNQNIYPHKKSSGKQFLQCTHVVTKDAS